MNIKVLGPGCAKCNKTERMIKEVIAETGIDAEVEGREYHDRDGDGIGDASQDTGDGGHDDVACSEHGSSFTVAQVRTALAL